MGARTTAREAALQMLFAADVANHKSAVILRDFWREFPGDADDRRYADAAVQGVLNERERIDEQLVRASANWRLERMNAVARNVLRLGTWELLERLEVPRAVIIDESVDLAKRFGTLESGAFVNGVLDTIADNCGRKDTDRPPASSSPSPPQSAPTDDQQ